jgi:hypothetical protein
MNQPPSQPETVFEIVQRLLNSTDTIVAVANSCKDYINARQGYAVGKRMQRDTEDCNIIVSAIFAAHSATLCLCYDRPRVNLPVAYLDALNDIAVWQLRENEEAVVQIFSFNSYSTAGYICFGKLDSNTNHFPSLRTLQERRDHGRKISCAAEALLKFIQQTLGAQQQYVSQTSPAEAETYRG